MCVDLCAAVLPILMIRLKSHFGGILRVFKCRLMLSENRINLSPSFLVCLCPPFSFLLSHSQIETYILESVKRERENNLVCLLAERKCSRFFSAVIMLAVSWCIAFARLRDSPSCLVFWEFLSHVFIQFCISSSPPESHRKSHVVPAPLLPADSLFLCTFPL